MPASCSATPGRNQAVINPRDLLIAYISDSATLADRPDDRTLWKQAERVIIPTLEYAQSLEATPIYSITRWIPPVGLRLATVIVLDVEGKTSIEITHENG